MLTNMWSEHEIQNQSAIIELKEEVESKHSLANHRNIRGMSKVRRRRNGLGRLEGRGQCHYRLQIRQCGKSSQGHHEQSQIRRKNSPKLLHYRNLILSYHQVKYIITHILYN